MRARRLLLVAACCATLASPALCGQQSAWSTVDVVNSNYYSGISCSDPQHCMATANFQSQGAAVVRRTTDGGISWQNVYEDKFTAEGTDVHIPTSVWCVSHPTPQVCIVGADSGVVLRTSDGGETWQRVQLDIVARITLVRMADAQHGLLVAREGFAYTTADGGETWQSAPIPPVSTTDYALWDVAYLPPQTWRWLMLAENSYTTRITEDNGATWHSYPGPDLSFAWSFQDAMRGVAVGGREDGDKVHTIVRRTEDGGRTWSVAYDQATQPYGVLQNVAFADPLHGIAGCSSGTILRTTDGGASWQQEATGLPAGAAVTAVAFPAPSSAFCVSFFGDILRSGTTVSGVHDSRRTQSALRLTRKNNAVHIALPSSEPNSHLAIYSSQGRLVDDISSHASSSGNAIEYSTESLDPGVYFLHYRTLVREEAHTFYVIR